MNDDNPFSPRPPLPPGDRLDTNLRSDGAGQAMSPNAAPPPAGVKGLWARVWHTSTPPQQTPRSTDSVREVVETVVFVVVLVLLLKSFAAEAFVIPTGSMAVTLYGYQKDVTCIECGHEFPVNCSQEADPQDGKPQQIIECYCENCGLKLTNIGSISCDSGDRVLVAKYLYDGPIAAPGDIWRELMSLIAIVAAAVVGAMLSGAVVRWLLRSRGNRNAPALLLYPARLAGAGVVAVGLGFFLFDSGPAWAMAQPARDDVVVFKYPAGPQKNFTPMNYIKRLIGLPGETIAICGGKLYYLPAGKEPRFRDEGKTELDRWKMKYVHSYLGQDGAAGEKRIESEWEPDFVARDLFNAGHFHIIRKKPAVMLALRRLVYNNDHQAKDLQGKPGFVRWLGEDGAAWAGDGASGFRHAAGAGPDIAWLRYHHRFIPERDRNPASAPGDQLIQDIMSYNTNFPHPSQKPGRDWVSDLILECEVTVEEPTGQLRLELSKSKDRFRARFDLADGTCTLVRLDKRDPTKEIELKTVATALKGKGTYRLRFANVDDRLTVWVDGSLPFADGVEYDPIPVRNLFPTQNDLQPASIGITGGGVRIQKIKLWRDTYYSVRPGDEDVNWEVNNSSHNPLPLRTMYIPDRHYLCLGDNSKESSDSRIWGLVPERLMLGRALLIYYPFGRMGRIQ